MAKSCSVDRGSWRSDESPARPVRAVARFLAVVASVALIAPMAGAQVCSYTDRGTGVLGGPSISISTRVTDAGGTTYTVGYTKDIAPNSVPGSGSPANPYNQPSDPPPGIINDTPFHRGVVKDATVTNDDTGHFVSYAVDVGPNSSPTPVGWVSSHEWRESNSFTSTGHKRISVLNDGADNTTLDVDAGPTQQGALPLLVQAHNQCGL